VAAIVDLPPSGSPRKSRARAALVVFLGLALAGAAACGGDTGTSSSGSQAPATAAPATPTAAPSAAPNPCHSPAPGSPSTAHFNAEPAMTIDIHAAYTAALNTNCGAVTLSLLAAQAPHTVNSFVFLAGQKYFDHSPCHRLTTAGIFVLQCGDPTGTGTGGPGYTIPDENLNGATYAAGTVAMANTGQPHTGGSQFFLVYRDTQLPPSYTPFAKVTAGLDILQQIAALGTTNGSPDGPPKGGVVIDSVAVTKA
jgi:peptidyl-prolyl cis-trans isomerase B (cyclophilin B)